MTVITHLKDKLAGLARSEERDYSAGSTDERPLAGYAATMSAYAAVVAAIAATARATGRDIPDGLDLRQVALTAAATHKLSRLLAKGTATSPLRAGGTSAGVI